METFPGQRAAREREGGGGVGENKLCQTPDTDDERCKLDEVLTYRLESPSTAPAGALFARHRWRWLALALVVVRSDAVGWRPPMEILSRSHEVVTAYPWALLALPEPRPLSTLLNGLHPRAIGKSTRNEPYEP